MTFPLPRRKPRHWKLKSKFLTDVDAGTQDATDSVEKTDADVDPDSSNRCPPDSNYHHRQAKKLGQRSAA